ncbi:MAG TPA: hypothetical protein PKZ76_10620 [Xanthomonadaceae bacterium]|nr:hypothetical protein [Xanthomonadaceae bacterium]
MNGSSISLLPLLGTLVLVCGFAALLAGVLAGRRRRADQTILDAFELGGRMSLDPVEVTGSALLRRRIEALRVLGLLKASGHGMLVPDQAGLTRSIARRKRLGRMLVLSGLVLSVAGAVLAWPLVRL